MGARGIPPKGLPSAGEAAAPPPPPYLEALLDGLHQVRHVAPHAALVPHCSVRGAGGGGKRWAGTELGRSQSLASGCNRYNRHHAATSAGAGRAGRGGGGTAPLRDSQPQKRRRALPAPSPVPLTPWAILRDWVSEWYRTCRERSGHSQAWVGAAHERQGIAPAARPLPRALITVRRDGQNMRSTLTRPAFHRTLRALGSPTWAHLIHAMSIQTTNTPPAPPLSPWSWPPGCPCRDTSSPAPRSQ
jgi:hypothetical protein